MKRAMLARYQCTILGGHDHDVDWAERGIFKNLSNFRTVSGQTRAPVARGSPWVYISRHTVYAVLREHEHGNARAYLL